MYCPADGEECLKPDGARQVRPELTEPINTNQQRNLGSKATGDPPQAVDDGTRSLGVLHRVRLFSWAASHPLNSGPVERDDRANHNTCR